MQCLVSYNWCNRRYLKRKDFEFLQDTSWFLKLCTFYKIFKNKPPCYLYELLLLKLPLTTQDCLTLYPFFYIGQSFFKHFCFFSTVVEQENLDLFIHKSESLSISCNSYPSPSSTNNCLNTKRLGDFKLYFSV